MWSPWCIEVMWCDLSIIYLSSNSGSHPRMHHLNASMGNSLPLKRYWMLTTRSMTWATRIWRPSAYLSYCTLTQHTLPALGLLLAGWFTFSLEVNQSTLEPLQCLLHVTILPTCQRYIIFETFILSPNTVTSYQMPFKISMSNNMTQAQWLLFLHIAKGSLSMRYSH